MSRVLKIRMVTGTTAAGATPTLCKMCVFAVNTDESLTLLGAIANDTALFDTANVDWKRSLLTAVPLIAGRRYAAGVLVVTGATMPSFAGTVATRFTRYITCGSAPVQATVWTSQSDVPSSLVAPVSWQWAGEFVYAELLTV